MAAGRHPCRLFVVAQDSNVQGNLVFNLNVKRLFSQKCQTPNEDELPLLSLPDPVTCFKLVELRHEYMAFAASPSGHVIGYKGQTLLYDAAADVVSLGADTHSAMSHPFLVPVGDRMFFAISAYPGVDELEGPQPARFEALQQHPRTGRWAWTV